VANISRGGAALDAGEGDGSTHNNSSRHSVRMFMVSSLSDCGCLVLPRREEQRLLAWTVHPTFARRVHWPHRVMGTAAVGISIGVR